MGYMNKEGNMNCSCAVTPRLKGAGTPAALLRTQQNLADLMNHDVSAFG